MTKSQNILFIQSQTMILFAFKGRFTFLYESSYVFSMRINIFGDKLRVFRRQVSYHSKSILTNRIKQPNKSRYKTSLKDALYRLFSCKIQFSVPLWHKLLFLKGVQLNLEILVMRRFSWSNLFGESLFQSPYGTNSFF